MKSKTKATAKPNKSARKPKIAAKKTAKPEAPEKSRIGVLIADDHSVVREGLASLIGRRPDMTVIAEAANGREAVDIWKERRPDVTLLDLRMPNLDGAGATAALAEQAPEIRVLILTTYADDEAILPALRAAMLHPVRALRFE